MNHYNDRLMQTVFTLIILLNIASEELQRTQTPLNQLDTPVLIAHWLPKKDNVKICDCSVITQKMNSKLEIQLAQIPSFFYLMLIY